MAQDIAAIARLQPEDGSFSAVLPGMAGFLRGASGGGVDIPGPQRFFCILVLGPMYVFYSYLEPLGLGIPLQEPCSWLSCAAVRGPDGECDLKGVSYERHGGPESESSRPNFRVHMHSELQGPAGLVGENRSQAPAGGKRRDVDRGMAYIEERPLQGG